MTQFKCLCRYQGRYYCYSVQLFTPLIFWYVL